MFTCEKKTQCYPEKSCVNCEVIKNTKICVNCEHFEQICRSLHKKEIDTCDMWVKVVESCDDWY